MNITCSRHLYFQRLLATWLTGLRASSLARLAAVAVFSLVMLQATAQAAAFTPADEKSVRSVIQAQLAAFAKDDATKAFSYAAPNVRKAIGTASRFLNMVQNDYPVVYRPASVAF